MDKIKEKLKEWIEFKMDECNWEEEICCQRYITVDQVTTHFASESMRLTLENMFLQLKAEFFDKGYFITFEKTDEDDAEEFEEETGRLPLYDLVIYKYSPKIISGFDSESRKMYDQAVSFICNSCLDNKLQELNEFIGVVDYVRDFAFFDANKALQKMGIRIFKNSNDESNFSFEMLATPKDEEKE